ncbi:MAG: aldehyde dehydrogenase (NADP(+)) [Pseudomonadales bacterium]|jgi:alpha-ketoglutaric semialdehyde dehydrogenase
MMPHKKVFIMLKNKHLIAGEWLSGETTFTSSPAHGGAHKFANGTVDLVNKAAKAAEDAFWSFGSSSIAVRAAFLDKIAEEIDARGSDITKIGSEETGLPTARLEGERGRTVGQLRLFARHIEKINYLDARHDIALPDRLPLPRPDIKSIQRPIGPVAVFGASNFPLAFSAAGGDTAAALAAGCPVVVKGHSAHPGTADIVAQAIDVAIKACDIHPGVFSLIQAKSRDVGTALVQHPLINAVGFTGSLGGGRALFNLCSARPTPIPFFGELGSVNPMFFLPNAMASRAVDMGKAWAGSLAMGAGQFCTNPGIAVVLDGPDAEVMIDAMTAALKEMGPQTMLTDGIANAYRCGVKTIQDANDVTELVGTNNNDRSASPYLYDCSADTWLANHELREEVFGPLGLIVRASNLDQMLSIAKSLVGQLTCTLHMDEKDNEVAASFIPILERKAGRILANGFPTGVELSDAMVHGGPYPASTNFGATSVGTMSIRRFLRPVSYQNIPESILSI